MAQGYTKLIDFKVKDGAIRQATERLFKSLDRIEKKLDAIGGKGGKGFNQVAKGAEKAASSFKKFEAASNSVRKASEKTRGTIAKLSIGAVALAHSAGLVDKALRQAKGPFGAWTSLADLTTKKVLALKTHILGLAAAHPALAGAVIAGVGAYTLFGSKIFDVKRNLTGFVDKVKKAEKAVRQFVTQVKAPKGELTIFDRIQSAKGGGLIGLQKLLDQVTAAQARLISTNRGYVAQSEQVRAVEKALTAELMARKRVMDQIIMSEQSRTPTSSLTAAAGQAGGLEGLRDLLAEAQGIQDRMLTTNEKYKVASARVKNIQKTINAELKERDRIMGKVNEKEQKSVTLGEKLRGIASKVGGKAVQAARPGRGIERRGLFAGGLGATAGLGMAAGGSIGSGIGAGLGKVSGAASWMMGGIPGLHGAGAGLAKATTDITTLSTAAKGLGTIMASHPAIIGTALAAWVAFGDKGIRKAIENMFGLGKQTRKTTASLFKFGKNNAAINQIGRELQISKDAMQKLGIASEKTANQLRRVKSNVRASAIGREVSGFAAWDSKTQTQLAAKKSLERKNKRLVQQGEERLTGERLITKELKKQNTVRDRAINKQQKQINNMFTDQARRERRSGARIRLMGKKMGINRLGGKDAESLMLGAGFPMLFGGGLGSVAGGVGGSVIGNAMGMGGFGTQIIGSAIGAQLEAVHNRVVEIGNATQTLNLDALEQSGIRVNAQLELQIRKLKRIGDYKGAQKALDKQVFWTTGGAGELNRDISTGVAALQESWNGFLAAAGTSLGIVFTPIVYALTAILKLVQGIFFTFNLIVGFILGAIKDGVVWLLNKIPGGAKLVERIGEGMKGLNANLDQIKVKYGEIVQDLEKEKDAILLKLQYGEKEAAIRQRIADLSHLATNEKEKEALEISIRRIAALEEEWKYQSKLRGEIENLLDPMWQLSQVAKTVEDSFTEGFKSIIKGSQSAQEALARLFQRTADLFLDMAAQMIAKQIAMKILGIGFSFFGGGGGAGAGATTTASSSGIKIGGIIDPAGKAAGGPVTGGKPYIIGEEGPELFTPRGSGHITPNHELGGGSSNVTVNVDASGSAVEGDGAEASRLGKMLGAAIQAELIKQRRPGGLLTR